MLQQKITIRDLLLQPRLMYIFIKRVPQFFTNWFLVVILLNYYVSRVIDIHFLAFFVCLTFLYIQYITPRQLFVIDNNTRYLIEDLDLLLISVIFHIIPLVYVLIYIPFNTKDAYLRITNAILLLLVYINIYNPETVYNVSSNVFITSFVLSFAIVNILYLKTKAQK